MKSRYLQRQQKIHFIQREFTRTLSDTLNLTEVQAPLLVDPTEGTQDTLSGYEQAVKVTIPSLQKDYEIVHSLAKWKRQLLGQYGFEPGEGILTQMKALRPDEEKLGAMHSVFVDQWDWEQVINPEQRNKAQLQQAARAVYHALVETLAAFNATYGGSLTLPAGLKFISAAELLRRHPALTAKERERAIAREYGAVFITGIGAVLNNGQRHDVRAPDYDDWSSVTEDGEVGLNGDLLVWNEVLNEAMELSSMGIRVDETALLRQLELSGCLVRCKQPWHQALLSGKLPSSVGGGIGQSRVCMFLMQQPHIGYVQSSVWCQQTHAQYTELLP